MLLDDWGPNNGQEWNDTSRSTWHYDPSTEEEIAAARDATSGDLVLQMLSDATGRVSWVFAVSNIALIWRYSYQPTFAWTEAQVDGMKALVQSSCCMDCEHFVATSFCCASVLRGAVHIGMAWQADGLVRVLETPFSPLE